MLSQLHVNMFISSNLILPKLVATIDFGDLLQHQHGLITTL